MTAVLVELVLVVFARLTVAVKSVWAPGATLADDGLIETEVTVVAALPFPQPDKTAIAAITTESNDNDERSPCF